MPFDSIKFTLVKEFEATKKALIKKGILIQSDIDIEKPN